MRYGLNWFFNKWFNEYFCEQQGEDSPYNYQDIENAFKAGWFKRMELRKEVSE